jgi:predicted metallo-beta-lactamase superfamily hydrolase
MQEDLDRRVGVVSLLELKVVKREWELQEKKEEITRKVEHERNELTSHADDLGTREAALEMEREHLRKMCEDLYNCELAISF